MWREFIESFGLTCFFGTPATWEELDELETEIGSWLPPELRELLAETNGVTFKPRFTGEMGVAELAAEENWVFDLFRFWGEDVVPPIHHLIFFGAQPNGDSVALWKDAGADQPSVVVMSHENSRHRRVMSSSLREYVTDFLKPANENTLLHS